MPTPSSIHILIVEDDPAVADTVKIILNIRGHRVEVANIANYALDLLERYTFDLIILDVMLPIMDGYELLQEIERRHGIAPEKIVMMSARQQEEDLERARQTGIKTYITKPFTADEFLSTLREHVATHLKAD